MLSTCASEVLLLLSLAGRGQGDIAGALAALRQAIALAEPEGFVRAFVDEGYAGSSVNRIADDAGVDAWAERLYRVMRPLLADPAQHSSTVRNAS